MRKKRLILVGPCGVGKSTIAAKIQSAVGIPHLDFDEYRRRADAGCSACSLSQLDLPRCLAPFLDEQPGGYIIDFGGDTVFRRTASDNDERLQQVFRLKREQGIEVVLLDGDEDTVRSRFLCCKSRKPHEFDEPWQDWLAVGRRWWNECADRVVDTKGDWLRDEAQLADLLGSIVNGCPPECA